MWEEGIDIRQIREIRTRSTVYFGVGAIQKCHDLAGELRNRGIDRVLITTGHRSYRSCGAWEVLQSALQAQNIAYELYDRVTPNPTVDQVEEAVALGRGAGAVIAIGGGSPIDAGKGAAILLANPGVTARDLFEGRFSPTAAVPILAINLTHGTGSETNRFAVVSIPEKDYKPVIACDCIYPEWAIDDPALTTGLSPRQTRFVSIDAVNHVVEAATTVAAGPYAVTLAAETIRLVAEYLPRAERNPEDLEARYFLMYAALIAGVAFDNGVLHFTHALEHPLSAVKPELSHGLGLSMLLPAVVKQIYPACSRVLGAILAPLVPGLRGEPEEALAAARGVECWLARMGVPEKLQDEGFAESDVARLTELAFTTPSLDFLLSLAPVPASRETVAAIYRDSLLPLAETR